MGVLSRAHEGKVLVSASVASAWPPLLHHQADAASNITSATIKLDDDDATVVAARTDKMKPLGMSFATCGSTSRDAHSRSGWHRNYGAVAANEFLMANALAYLPLCDMLRAASIARSFATALGSVNEVRMASRCLCLPSLMRRFEGAKCLTIEGGIDLFNAMGLLAWPLQTSLRQVCQINFKISGNEIGDDARGFQHWERGLKTLARSGALRHIRYMSFSFLGRLKGVTQYLTHAAFEAIFLTERPWRLLSLECALLVAASHPEIDAWIAVELLRRGADPNAATPNWNYGSASTSQGLPARGTPALLLAAEANNRDVVKALLSAGADPSACAPSTNKTALHCAVTNNYYYSFRDDDRAEGAASTRIIVYSTPMPPPILEKRRRPPLVRYERAALVELLVAAGADVNATDAEGNTPLITALASCGDLDWDAPAVIKTTQALLVAGADVSIRNKAGHTALTIAVARDKPIEVLGTLAEAEVASPSNGAVMSRESCITDGKRARVGH